MAVANLRKNLVKKLKLIQLPRINQQKNQNFDRHFRFSTIAVTAAAKDIVTKN